MDFDSRQIMLQDKALETAQRFVDYDSYEKRESKAVYALKKKCPGWRQEEYYTWLRLAIELHQDAIEYLDENSERAWERYEANKDSFSFEGIAGDFVEEHREFHEDLVLGTLMWVFYWYHLR